MATASDTIIQALKKAAVLGQGQQASAEMMNDGFLDLNDMLAQWQRERWLIWDLRTAGKISTGAMSYTVTTGGDFDMPRPDRIESAFLRQLNISNPVDYYLEILQSREDYNKITLKTLGTFPEYVFYQSSFPTGQLFAWPIPQANLYEIFISIKEPLTQYTELSDNINMPPEYNRALKLNLAKLFRINYGLPERMDLTTEADIALNIIINANVQVPRLVMPKDLTRTGQYNIYSDQVR